MLIIPLNLDSVLLLLHNSKLAYWTFKLLYVKVNQFEFDYRIRRVNMISEFHLINIYRFKMTIFLYILAW